jgi:hypothetical protein
MSPAGVFLSSKVFFSEGLKRNCHARKDRNRVATVNIELWSAINVA